MPSNLWQPGQSGNPKGRPKGSHTSIRGMIRAMLDQPYSNWTDADGKPLTHAQAISQTIYRVAVEEGDVQAMKLVVESVDGRMPLTIQHRTDDPKEMDVTQIGEVMAHIARVRAALPPAPVDAEFTVREELPHDVDDDGSVDAPLDHEPEVP